MHLDEGTVCAVQRWPAKGCTATAAMKAELQPDPSSNEANLNTNKSVEQMTAHTHSMPRSAWIKGRRLSVVILEDLQEKFALTKTANWHNSSILGLIKPDRESDRNAHGLEKRRRIEERKVCEATPFVRRMFDELTPLTKVIIEGTGMMAEGGGGFFRTFSWGNGIRRTLHLGEENQTIPQSRNKGEWQNWRWGRNAQEDDTQPLQPQWEREICRETSGTNRIWVVKQCYVIASGSKVLRGPMQWALVKTTRKKDEKDGSDCSWIKSGMTNIGKWHLRRASFKKIRYVTQWIVWHRHLWPRIICLFIQWMITNDDTDVIGPVCLAFIGLLVVQYDGQCSWWFCFGKH